MVLREDGEVDSDSSCEDSSSCSGGESSSEGSHYDGDLIIMRRLMSNIIEEEIKSQRETILVLAKLCSLIIDGEVVLDVSSLDVENNSVHLHDLQRVDVSFLDLGKDKFWLRTINVQVREVKKLNVIWNALKGKRTLS
ncbi:hypothetical protein CR513_05980, partial [Mucuna pruriens]